ncbi:MAG: hypothetical protein JKY65_16050 [Planctomycetes bacterium]|nr:hypothetical protein [Planctomycetota bacterium]
MLRSQIDPTEATTLAPFRAALFARPYKDGGASGDRVALHVEGARALFLVADAAGHGERGEAFWDRHQAIVMGAWQELLESAGTLPDLRGLGATLNAALHEAGDHLCLSVGVLEANGVLRFANFGYGTHVLPVTTEGSWWREDPAELFGLKLGWLPSPAWNKNPRAFVGHELSDTKSLVSLSDAFLGDDHRDPIATLESLPRLSGACAGLAPAAAVEEARRLPHDDDDATVLALVLDRE